MANSIGVSVEIAKVDERSRFVVGWASVSSIDGQPVTDSQGDIIGDDELENAANSFMRQSRAGKVMHKGDFQIDYTQSLVLTPAVKQALGIQMTPDKTGWLVGGFCDEATYQRIQNGELRALSIGGSGVRQLIEEKPPLNQELLKAACDRLLAEAGLPRRSLLVEAAERMYGPAENDEYLIKADDGLLVAMAKRQAAETMQRLARPLGTPTENRAEAERRRRQMLARMSKSESPLIRAAEQLAETASPPAGGSLVAMAEKLAKQTAAPPTSYADMLAAEVAWSLAQDGGD